MFAFDERTAVRYGLDEAVMIQSFTFWLKKNAANGTNYFEGHWWTFNSHEALAQLFPFWTQKQIRRIIASLVRQGALVKGDFNPNRFDRTCWYRLGDELERALPGQARPSGSGSSEAPGQSALNCPNGHVNIGTVTAQLYTSYGSGADAPAPAPAHEGETPRPATDAGGGEDGDREGSVPAQSQERKSAPRPGRAPFVPPTIAEVREYIALRGSDIDPVAFFSFYENRDWRLNDGRRMKDWRLAVVTWERRDRNGRRG